MSYTLIKKKSPNSESRGGTKITEIVIHHWGKEGQSFDGVTNWLCNPRAGTSAHYVAMSGKVAQIVDDSLTAWHAGNYNHNLKSIGIECRPEATEGDYETVAELVANLWKKHGKLPLVRHKDIVATACPGKWDIGKIKTMAEKLHGSGTVIPPKKPNGVVVSKSVYDTDRSLTVKEAVMAGQAWSNKLLGTKITIDGLVGSDTRKNAVKVLQWGLNSDYGARLIVDGISGTATKKALGHHTVRQGETQYMVTALQVLLLMNGYNPHGVERPGTFGSGCAKATGRYQSDTRLVVDKIAGRDTFLKLTNKL